MPTTFIARSLPEFFTSLANVSIHSIYHHFIEARLRLQLTSNDFSRWLTEEAGQTEIARSVNRIDIYMGTMEDVRRQIIRIVERALN